MSSASERAGSELTIEQRVMALEAVAHEPQSVPIGNIMARLEALERRASPPQANPASEEAAFIALEADPHQWSTRPCGTCQKVTKAIGRPFGCMNPSNDRRHYG